MNDLGDVTIGTLSDNQILQYNSVNGQWENVDNVDNVVSAGGTWTTDLVGINTTKNVGIGTTAKDGYKLYVEGDARVTGILTVGPASVTIDGINNSVTATTFNGNLSGDVTGNVTGTATTATNLDNAANITTGTISNDRLPSTITKDLVGNITGDVTGTATTATNLADAANITTGTISNDRLPVNLNLSGIITASAFYGDASNLTGLTGASAATYGNATAVPQIVVDANGRISSISNVLISGSGSGGSSIIINDSGSLVGAAGTIDFGDGLSVSPVSAGIVTVTGIGTSRFVASNNTGSIGAGTTADITITGAKTYSLLKINTSHAAWVRLYTDTTSRTNDATRAYTTDPTPGSGVLAEVYTTTTGSNTFKMTPGVVGWNDDGTPSTNIYAKVTNNESGAADITVSLTIVRMED